MKQQLRAVLANPKLLAREVNRLYYRASKGQFNSNGVEIFGEDWDNLIILDACRYDLFEKETNFDGELYKRESKASNTIQFLRANFTDAKLTDTVYITANPQYERYSGELSTEFHAVINVWAGQGWDEQLQTVRPEVMTEEIRTAIKQFPKKRLLIHYNQPHIPFIGPIGQTHFDIGEISQHQLPFWQQPMAGVWNIEDHTIWSAYTENLDYVLPYVKDLLKELSGRTVVTSDHGNMIGERAFPIPIREYGHPDGILLEKLITIPWLISESGERKKVIDEDRETKSADTSQTHEVEERLQYLGYK